MLRAGRVLRRADHKHIASFTDTWNSVKGFHLLAGRLSDSLPVRREHCASHLLGNEIPSLLLQEYGVLRSFLLRSRLCHDSQFRSLRGSRWFHSSSSSSNQQQNNDSNKGSDKNAKSDKDDKEDKEDKDDKERKQMLAKLITILLFYGAPLYWMMMMHYSNPSSNSNVGPTFLSWSEFLHQMLAKGEVKQLTVDAERKMVRIHLHDGAIIRGKPASPFNYVMPVDDIAQFEEKLRAAEIQLGIKPEDAVTVVFERPSDSWGKHIFDLLLIGFLIWVALKLKANTGIMDGVMGGLTKAKFTLVEPLAGGGRGVKFSDIAGLKEAKTEVMEFVDYLKRPEHYRRLGAKVPKGTLLLGPPGCGKTLLAKAVATEANVPFLSMNGTEFIEVIGGLGASRVRSLFKEARKRVPCIVYIDEIDAIGRKRFNEQGGEGDQTLNQLLVELDGMATKEGVIMLASTNRAEVLDKALLRPGRFDRHILIDLPTVEERKEIFEQYLKQIKLEEPPTFYSRRLAHLTPGYSGADIANICNEAALHAARFQHKIVRGDDLEYAVERVQYGAEKKQHSVSFTERQRFAYYLAGRTLVGWMLEHTDAMLKVSVVQRTKAMGNLQLDRSERFLISNDELYDRMTMFIAGKAAESIIFNQNSTVSEEDLKKVTNIAYGMVEVYGMNQNVGLLSFRRAEHQKRMYSRKLHSTIDFEARKIIIESYDRASRILEENKDKLKLIAEELLKRESLTYTDICNLIGPPPFGHKRQVEGINFGGVLSEKTDSPSSGDEPPVDEP